MLAFLSFMLFIGLGIGPWMARNKRALWITAGGVAGATMIGVVIGNNSTFYAGQIPSPPTGQKVLLSLNVDTDFGAVSATGVGSGQFCGSIGTLGTPEHCYPMQESSGSLIDSVGGNNMAAFGSPRYSVTAGVPVLGSDSSIDWTGEKTVEMDGSGYFIGTDEPAAVASVTFLFRGYPSSSASHLFDWGYAVSAAGYNAYINASGIVSVRARFGTAVARNINGLIGTDGAWHCVTIAYNGASTTGWVDGSVISWSGAWVDYGNTTSSGDVRLSINTGPLVGSLARFRLDHAIATISDHKALCGSINQVVRYSHPAYSNISWSQTGGSRCFQTGANQATCFAGGMPAYAYSGNLVSAGFSGYGWAVEAGRINKVLYSTAIDCVNYTCQGAATATTGKIGPDGSNTASELYVGGVGVDDLWHPSITTFTPSVTLYPRMWVKCSSGSLGIRNRSAGSTYGQWVFDCTQSAGQWVQIYTGAPGVTENYAWSSNASGYASLHWYAASGTVTAQVWIPTLTENPGLSVIPTTSSSSDTGFVTWSLDNDPAVYYHHAKFRINTVSEWFGYKPATSYPVTTTDSRYLVYLAKDYVRDSGSTWELTCNFGLGVTDRSLWWDSVGGTGGLDISGTPSACSATPSGPWTPATDPPIYRFANGSQWHNAIYRSIEFRDRP